MTWDRCGKVLAAAVAISAPLLAGAPADPPVSLTVVLERTGEYVVGFERDLSAVVSEERYVQDIVAAGSRLRRGPSGFEEHRELRSDLLLVHTDRTDGFVQFRDVFEVDGRPVRDRSDRLVALFLNQSSTSRNDTARILQESARYNIGRIERNVNVPVLALTFLHPDNQWRFKFSVKSRTGAQDLPKELRQSPNFTISTELWIVEYREVETPTMIRGAGGGLPAKGRFWIEPSTGRVLMSELEINDSNLRSEIRVSYQSEPLLGLLVPAEMRESYSQRNDPYTIKGSATYANFRRFQVQVDEKIAPSENRRY